MPITRLLKFGINALAAVICIVEAVEGHNIAFRILFAVAACGAALTAAVQIPAVRRIGHPTE